MARRRLGFVVTGRVQGVAFRAHCCSEAERLQLSGFVRNRPDGAVEGEAEGGGAQIAAFCTWLHRGSPWSKVVCVEVEELAATGAPPGFGVLR